MNDRPFRSAAIGASVWLVLCIGGGFVVLSRLGEYGSVVQPLVGLAAGLLGAVSHALFCMSSRFRALGFLGRALLNWLGAYLPFAGLAVLLTNFRNADFNPDFWPEALRLMVLYTGGPMLVVAALAAVLTSSRRRTDEA